MYPRKQQLLCACFCAGRTGSAREPQEERVGRRVVAAFKQPIEELVLGGGRAMAAASMDPCSPTSLHSFGTHTTYVAPLLIDCDVARVVVGGLRAGGCACSCDRWQHHLEDDAEEEGGQEGRRRVPSSPVRLRAKRDHDELSIVASALPKPCRSDLGVNLGGEVFTHVNQTLGAQ